MGVVYYGNYFTWFEIGRVELCRQIGFEYKKMEIEDDSFLVVGPLAPLALLNLGDAQRPAQVN